MSFPTILHFVRHGEVENPGQIYYGRLPNFHLSAVGRQQASAAAQNLSQFPIRALYHSPLQRAVETAAILAQPLGLIPQVSDALNEVYSAFDGQPMRVLAERNWDGYTGTDPVYEQPQDVLNRALQFVHSARKAHPGQQLTAVTHGDVIAFLVLWANQLPIAPEHKPGFYTTFLTPASIACFTFQTESENEIPTVQYWQPSPYPPTDCAQPGPIANKDTL